MDLPGPIRQMETLDSRELLAIAGYQKSAATHGCAGNHQVQWPYHECAFLQIDSDTNSLARSSVIERDLHNPTQQFNGRLAPVRGAALQSAIFQFVRHHARYAQVTRRGGLEAPNQRFHSTDIVDQGVRIQEDHERGCRGKSEPYPFRSSSRPGK